MKVFSIKITTCLLLIVLLFTSCIRKIALKYVGVYDTTLSTKKIISPDKEIVFFGMHHIGKKEFYDNAIKQLNELKANGYFVFYEGLNLTNSNDSLKTDIVFLKFRSLTGLDLSEMKKNKGYIDTTTGISLLPDRRLNKIIQKEKFINQPFSLIMPQDSLTGKKADADLFNLIQNYESKYGNVELTQYDKATPLGTKFDITKKQKISISQQNFLILDIRNIVLTVEILESSYKKIAIVYGKAHYRGLLKLLKDAKMGYVEIK